MSVARAVWLARPKPAIPSHLQCRPASSASHHTEEHHESTEFPKEGFYGPFWRNTALIGLLGFGAVNLAPEGLFTGSASPAAEDAPWLTRTLAHYATPKETWATLNAKHLEQTEEIAKHHLFLQSAKRPIVHRYRYPLLFEQVSTHCVPVGGTGDLSDLVVKGDKA